MSDAPGERLDSAARNEPVREREIEDEAPPFLGTWPNVYRLTLVWLALIIFLFWLFTRHYAPPPGA